jgi:RNA polymerase sigma-70 factor (ECF subfamily)
MSASVEDLNDGGLVRACIDHEVDAFSVLYRRYYPRLVRLLLRRTGDATGAEDLAQETLIRALQHLDTFDGNRPLWPWLKTIATNLAIDHSRQFSKETVKESPNERDAGCDLEWSEDAPILMEAMAQLPQRQRVALSLRYLDDWRSGEAASFLGLSRTSFEQLLLRGRRKLRDAYGELTSELSSVILLPLRALRRLGIRASVEGSRVTNRYFVFGEAGAATATQLLTAVIAVMLVGGTVAPPDIAHLSLRAASDSTPHHRLDSRPIGVHGGKTEQSARSVGAIPTSASAVADNAQAKDSGASKALGDALQPNRNVKQPEDAQIGDLAYSPNYAADRTVFATGTAHCKLPTCPPVLFRSRNGGHTWKKLFARRFDGDMILLPPAYGRGDDRIFAMGPSGLQVSENGGNSFRPLALGASQYAVGAAAISPAFNSGDPTILIGAQSLLKYNDGSDSVEPAPYTSLPGPLEPAYASAYPVDQRILVGGLHVDPVTGAVTSTVWQCNGSLCRESVLGDQQLVPKIRLAPDFDKSQVTYAFTQSDLFASPNGGLSFALVKSEWDGTINDVAVGESGRTIFAAIGQLADAESAGTIGLYVSRDAGRTWKSVGSPLFKLGAASVVLEGKRVVASRGERGVACSSDLGRTWTKRCS